MRSMTAFARAETQIGRGRMVVEIRSVNHRYLQPGFHLARECSELESAWRDRLREVCTRGKVDVFANIQSAASESRNERLDTARLRRLMSLSRHLHSRVDRARLLTANSVWSASPASADTLLPAAQQSFEEALEVFVAQRESEGGRLQGLLREQLDEAATLIGAIRERRPEIREALRTRWQERLQELQASLKTQRIEEEITVQVIRADIDEELDRLDSHITETRATLEAADAQGRKLDFLMQEFVREANTLAAKAPDLETTNAAMSLKIAIEQMREQVQNVE